MSTGPDRRAPSFWLATWFGAGLLPWVPGTWGSLAALPFAWLFVWAGGPLLLMAACAVLLAAGLWAAARYIEASGQNDPGPVVVDEVVGQWIALVPVALTPLGYLLGFVLFRLFDITKPWPAGWIDRNLPGAQGVMLDDVVAGVYAGLVVTALQLWGL